MCEGEHIQMYINEQGPLSALCEWHLCMDNGAGVSSSRSCIIIDQPRFHADTASTSKERNDRLT